MVNLHGPSSNEGHQSERDGEDNPEKHVWSTKKMNSNGKVFSPAASVCQHIILRKSTSILTQAMTAEFRRLKQSLSNQNTSKLIKVTFLVAPHLSSSTYAVKANSCSSGVDATRLVSPVIHI